MKHTPGPWHFDGIGTITRRKDRTSDQTDICYMNDEGGNDSSEWFADPEVVQADARLIAASPDLLEALKDARDMLCSHPDFQEIGSLDKYDSIIAKAEGTLDTQAYKV